MGRKEEIVQLQNIGVKVPSFFRCPISLDVMKSPVSLCTGITYDRSSIRRWLDSGNNTCPATMQPLLSTDLVPNLTLQSLINFWSASVATDTATFVHRHPAADILRDLSSSVNPAPCLSRLADFLLDADNDDFDKNRLIGSGSCATTLSAVVCKNGSQIEILEAAFRVLALILTSEFIEESNKKLVISSLVSNLDSSVSSLLFLLGKNPDSRIEAARVLDSILTSEPDSRVPISEKPDLIPELIRLIGSTEEGVGKEKMDRSAIEVGLACLVTISGVRRARVLMVKKGVVTAAKNILMADASTAPATAAEKALKLLEVASGLPEGRSTICESAEEFVEAILGRMMKVGRKGTEAAVMVLWSVCHLFRDQRAVDAVMSANGGVTKILLLMQSDCSPAVRHMSGDLLKVFRVNAKSCLAGYDTKTTHIMPF
ncbi:U-box domain-containing protein 27-like [Phalaenopsis equestris]|uniref:U-box domain-containing protein 27-like n=1 Tax=Phalaenopsis equestris TaxID=78828 RepID=UPI0009E336C9|nr:U-box domain-containing protein 27-like [Phalaenopsis equestris]